MIQLDKRGKRIVLRTSEPLPGIRTAIPGAYETSAGDWTVPLTFETMMLLRMKYGKRLTLGTELQRWENGIRDRRDQMTQLAALEDTELDRLPSVAPRLYEAMDARTYQRVGVQFIANNTGTLLSDEPGLGKTLQIMGGILEADIEGPYLIIAPKTAARPVWEREIRRWLPSDHKPITFPELRYARESVLRRNRFGAKTWIIVHPEMVMMNVMTTCLRCKKRQAHMNRRKRKLKCGHPITKKTKFVNYPSFPKLFETVWGAIVIDESHESLIKRGSTPTQRRYGMDRLRLRADGVKIASSGTPMNNHPHQLWGTLNWLDPETYSAFHRWSELYWTKGGYSGYEIGEFRQDREKMLWDSLGALSIRRTKQEVAKDLPPKLYIGDPLEPTKPEGTDNPIGIWLEMEGKQLRAYEQMAKLSFADLRNGRLDAVTALAELTRLKQFATAYGDIEKKDYWNPKTEEWEFRYLFHPDTPSNKFNWIRDTLEEWGFPDNPVDKVVMGSFYSGIMRAFAQRLEEHFKTKPGNRLSTGITGRVSARQRASRLERFNSDEPGPQIMWLNVKAGGTAITIDSSSRTIMISETRIPDQQTQLEDRTHRVSNPRQCFYYYLRSLDTVDVGTAISNANLLAGSHRLLDTRRGVEYLREILRLSV